MASNVIDEERNNEKFKNLKFLKAGESLNLLTKNDDDKSQINEEFNENFDEWICIAFQPEKIIYEEKKYLSDGLKQKFEFE